jgi:hypothetical protein
MEWVSFGCVFEGSLNIFPWSPIPHHSSSVKRGCQILTQVKVWNHNRVIREEESNGWCAGGCCLFTRSRVNNGDILEHSQMMIWSIYLVPLLTHNGGWWCYGYGTPIQSYLSIYLSTWAKYVVHMTCSWNGRRTSFVCCQWMNWMNELGESCWGESRSMSKVSLRVVVVVGVVHLFFPH